MLLVSFEISLANSVASHLLIYICPFAFGVLGFINYDPTGSVDFPQPCCAILKSSWFCGFGAQCTTDIILSFIPINRLHPFTLIRL